MGNLRLKFKLVLGFVIVALVFSQETSAQTVPSSADPARQIRPLKQDDDLKKVKPPAPQKQTAQAPILSPEIANLKFTLNKINIEGATAFPIEQLEGFYKKNIGLEINFSNLVDIMLSIQQLYYDSGFTLSQVSIPEQDIKTGNITFQVIEGYIGEVQIDPMISDTDLISRFKSTVLSMHPLNTKKLERLMLVLNDRPGLDVSSVLSAIDNKSVLNNGAVKLTLKKNSDSKNKTRRLEFDNYGSNFSGSGQVTAGIDFIKNLPNYSDLSFGFTQTTSVRELRQGSVSYTVPILGVSGTTLGLSGSISSTEPGGNLDDLDIKGLSKNVTGSISYPIIRQRDKTLLLSSGFDFRNTKTDILDERLSEDRIRKVFFDTKYTFSDALFGINILNAKYSQGFDVLNSRQSGSIDLSREEGRSDFKKIELSATRLQQITNTVDILATARGQYTNDPLLSSEEFGFGGAALGRGYDPSEITGDKGFSFSVEVRQKGNLNLSFKSINYQLYGFYDFGKVWNIDPLSKSNISAASTGLGARLFLSDNCQMDFNVALPLTKRADSPPKYSNEYSPRFLFSLKYAF